MDPIVWEREPPVLRSPVLVASFSGWNDAANAASTALGAIAASVETELVARIDPEEFFDFQANRPTIDISGGQMRGVEWPDNLIVAGTAPEAERDLLIISGTEPSTRWRTFCNAVLDVAERCGVESVVTFGSLIADVAHTRPVPITGLATEDEMIEQLGFEDVAYEGPTGVLGVFHGACRERGMAAASLWAAVPHYAAAVPNPKAGLALLRRLEGMIGIAVEASELEEAAESFEKQVTQAVAANPEIKEMVERLEEQQDEVAGFSQEDVPSGDAIAQEFQRFLRQQSD
jgi:proteasome assembly chaperone (PAC2) family protein